MGSDDILKKAREVWNGLHALWPGRAFVATGDELGVIAEALQVAYQAGFDAGVADAEYHYRADAEAKLKTLRWQGGPTR